MVGDKQKVPETDVYSGDGHNRVEKEEDGVREGDGGNRIVYKKIEQTVRFDLRLIFINFSFYHLIPISLQFACPPLSLKLIFFFIRKMTLLLLGDCSSLLFFIPSSSLSE